MVFISVWLKLVVSKYFAVYQCAHAWQIKNLAETNFVENFGRAKQILSIQCVWTLSKANRALCDVAQFIQDLLGCASRVHKILTTVMTRIVVDKSTDHAKPHSICFFYHNIKVIEINICLDNWKHRLGLESARAALFFFLFIFFLHLFIYLFIDNTKLHLQVLYKKEKSTTAISIY